jgi:hypothetical protein
MVDAARIAVALIDAVVLIDEEPPSGADQEA